MKLAVVVPRYGRDVIGGAETFARSLSERLAKFFTVEILTTCAISHTTWKNIFSPGIEKCNGLVVRRFSNDTVRSKEFPTLFHRLLFSKESTTILDEIEFQKLQGPYSTELLNYIRVNKDVYDLFCFVPYLFCTTVLGLLTVPDKSILIPTAHNEGAIYFDLFRTVFRTPRGIIYLSEEEKLFVHNLFHNAVVPHRVIGSGIDFESVDNSTFRKIYRLDFPYLLYAGRIEEAKGIPQLIDYFLRYKADQPSYLLWKLVLIGEKSIPLPVNRDIIYLGTLSELDKLTAFSSSELVIQPSLYESFSLVLLEAWSQNKPVLVNGNCDVLKGQVERSNGGLYYTNYLEFKECMDLLVADTRLRNKLGQNGFNYAKKTYSWDRVERQYVDFINSVI